LQGLSSFSEANILPALEPFSLNRPSASPTQPGDSAVLLRPAEIQRATVDGNHVRVDTVSAAYFIREPMHAVEARLPSSQFVRLSRSVLVSVDAIREIQRTFAATSRSCCATASHVITGRTYRERIRRRFSLV
jgi:two-component system response regulator LytT